MRAGDLVCLVHVRIAKSKETPVFFKRKYIQSSGVAGLIDAIARERECGSEIRAVRARASAKARKDVFAN